MHLYPINSRSTPRSTSHSSVLTLEVALGPQVRHGEAEDGQPVKFGENVLFKGEETRQVIELCIKAFPVSLGRVTLRLSVLRLRLYAGEGEK